MEPLRPLGIDHIVVPLDGSRLAEVAIAPALAVAARLHARVTLLHVLERNAPATVHQERHLTNAEEADSYLQDVASQFTAAGIPVDQHVHPNPERDVAASIAAHAHEFRVGLIVLCTHGHGGLREWLTGSLAQRVIRQARMPVLLARPQTDVVPPFELRTVVTALDGTKEGEAIMPAALTLARAFDAGLHLIIVVPTLATVAGDQAVTARLAPTATAAALDLDAAAAEEYMRDLAARTSPPAVRISSEVVRGDAVEIVAQRAGRDPACLLAMATHGRGVFDTFWTGSVGSRLTRRVTGPLLLVQPGAGQLDEH